MKQFFWAFAFIIVAFIVSATLLGQYHSPLSLLLGFGAAIGFNWAWKRWIKKW